MNTGEPNGSVKVRGALLSPPDGGETGALSAESEPGDDGAIPLHVGAGEVVEQPAAPATILSNPRREA